MLLFAHLPNAINMGAGLGEDRSHILLQITGSVGWWGRYRHPAGGLLYKC